MNREELLKKALALPLQPGVYLMMDRSGEVIYVGKAKALKNRVVSYFREGSHTPKTAVLVSHVDRFDVIMVRSEFEALITENQLIKQHRPRYNILLKDDKGYPYLKTDPSAEYPVFTVVGKRGTDSARYLGPFGSRTTIFRALDAIKKAFRLPLCSRRFPQEIGRGRPCLNLELGLCEGWCRGTPDSEEYRKRMKEACAVLEGRSEGPTQELQREMESAAEALDFEKAALLRDRLKALASLKEKQFAVSGSAADTDAAAFYRGEAKSCFSVLHYIGGRLLDKDFELLETPLEEDEGEVFRALLSQYYARRGTCPEKILLPVLPEDSEELARMLSEQYGKRTEFAVPQRGQGRARVDTALLNARQETERATAQSERISGTLKWLQKAAGLPNPPRRIEAYDISHLAGTDPVASMTVFSDTKPLKRAYRHFKIRDAAGGDDYDSLRETLRRRLEEFLNGNEKFAPLPDLFLIDGGAGQCAAVCEVLQDCGISLPVLGMVKDDFHRTRELVSSDGRSFGLESYPPAFTLVGTIQEETHRFAISYQQKLRSGRIGSSLDAIPGIGENRRNLLLKHFGSVRAIRVAELAELQTVLPKNAALAVYRHFRPETAPSPAEAFNKESEETR